MIGIPTTDSAKMSLVIPAYNEEKYIGACLDSVLENSGGQFIEIIVVDNASTDHTVEIARKRPGVRVVREDHKGITHARERGRVEASGDLIAYLDADCRLPKYWIDFARRFFREHPNAVSLSGPAIYFDGTPWQRVALGICWRIAAPPMCRLVGHMVYGAHFIVKKSELDAIGGFDRTIEFYGEDTDLGIRLSKRGKVVFRMDFFIITSVRRFAAEGLFRTNATYALNFLWPIFFHRPFSSSHRDVR